MRGFTLVELMITIAVLAIVSAIAVPSFSNAIADQRASSATNEFISSFQHARSYAIKEQRSVVLCASSDGSSCDTVASGKQSLSNFLLSFDGSNTLINVAQLPSGIDMQSYLGNQISISANGATNSGNLIICNNDLDEANGRLLSITSSGQTLSGDLTGNLQCG